MGKATRWLKGLFGMKTANKDTIPGKIGASGAERDRNKHAIAFAAATAAAADAAVVAAQAAVEVVRVTSRDRNHYHRNLIAGAVTIQTNFRGYLARKALRALKGLVKIQALVRGYLVRKQAAATLHGMEALFRAQATVQSRRASIGLNRCPARPDRLNWARLSMGEFGDAIETDQYYNAPYPSVRSRRMSATFEARTLDTPKHQGQDIIKVVEVDVGQPGSKSSRRGPDPSSPFSDLGEDPSSYQVLPSRFQLHFVPCQHDKEWGRASAHTTPRHSNLGIGPGADMLQQLYYHYPNYMAKTMSLKGKVRAQSAPKQRPEKRTSVSERQRRMIEGRNSTSVSGVRMHRPSSHVQEAFNFKNVVMGKIGKLPLLH